MNRPDDPPIEGEVVADQSWPIDWSTPAEVDAAADALCRGELVAFATETVYGLGADATSPEAVARIFEAKGRPSDHPLIVHLADVGQLGGWVASDLDPAVANDLDRLAVELWPGPLTLVVPRGPKALDEVTGGLPTVALRVPDHPLALRLLRSAGRGVAAPSANRFGRVSPTSAADVEAELGEVVDVVLDGGDCLVGLESTIVELVDDTPTVLRPGGVPAEVIEHVLGRPVERRATGPSRASGMLASHYAPTVDVDVVSLSGLDACVRRHRDAGRRVGVHGPDAGLVSSRSAEPGVIHLPAPTSPAEFGRRLYRTLRDVDDGSVDVLVVVPPQDDGLGVAIRDRLQKASAPRS